MQTACYRCGATLEEGVPFCPQCGAPQIRVPGPEQTGESPATPPLTPGTPADIQPAAIPVATSRVNWQTGIRAALIGGAVAALLSHVPIISIACCLWMVGAGVVAVWFYRRSVPGVVLTTGAGARLGAVAGVMAFLIYAVLGGLLLAFSSLVMGRGEDLRDEFRRAIEQSAGPNAGDPRVADMIAWMSTAEGMAVFATVFLVVMLTAFVAFGMVGGSIGAAMYAPKEPAPPRPE